MGYGPFKVLGVEAIPGDQNDVVCPGGGAAV